MTLEQAMQLAVQHHQAGRLVEAERIYSQILSQAPDQPDVLRLLGTLMGQTGRVDAAIELLGRAVQIQPGNAQAHNNLGFYLKEKGRLEEAMAAFGSAIEIEPDYAEAYSNLGGALKDRDRLDEAIAAYKRAIQFNPNSAETHNMLGIALFENGVAEESIAPFNRAIQLKADYAEAHNNLGASLTARGRLDEAIAACNQAIVLKPNFADAYSNLGNALMEAARLDEAIASYRRAIEIKPDFAGVHSNMGNALKASGRLDEASAHFRLAIQIAPDLALAHWNYALLLLSMGRFAEGWKHFHWRLALPFLRLNRGFAQPQWDGGDLNGKTLLLHTEGGYGDALQFVRYVSLLGGPGARLILECQPSLAPLFASVPGVDVLVARGKSLPDFDLHIPLQSLPGVFGTEVSSIPNRVPYLKPPTEYLSRWSRRLERDSRLKVGLAWAGSRRTSARHDLRTRSIEIFAPLAAAKNVRFYSLQKGTDSTQAPPDGLDLVDFTADLHDWADTAALVQNLDLVLSVDTSVAHLAGALGRPVWILPFPNDFRWLVGRDDSPWYPTMRLFHQNPVGDWTKAIKAMTAEFHAWADRQGRP